VKQWHPTLDDAAVKAVKQWKFSPTLLNGKGVPFDTTISIIFDLDEHDSPNFIISGS